MSKSLAVLGRHDGLEVRFCGMVGQDSAAQTVAAGFARYDARPCLLNAPGVTASCVCMVRVQCWVLLVCLCAQGRGSGRGSKGGRRVSDACA